MPVDIDPHFQMVDDGPLEVDSAPEGLPEHDSEAESDTGNSQLVPYTIPLPLRDTVYFSEPI